MSIKFKMYYHFYFILENILAWYEQTQMYSSITKSDDTGLSVIPTSVKPHRMAIVSPRFTSDVWLPLLYILENVCSDEQTNIQQGHQIQQGSITGYRNVFPPPVSQWIALMLPRFTLVMSVWLYLIYPTKYFGLIYRYTAGTPNPTTQH